MTKVLWRLFKTVLNKCIQFRATIFGGCIRDILLHNFHSKIFYKYHAASDYEDKTISPDTLGRLIIPHDIDMFILRSDYKKLLYHLMGKYAIKRIYTRDAHYLSSNIQLCTYTQVSFMIISFCGQDQIVNIKLDIIIQDDIDIPLTMPYTKLDFDVNGLYYNSSGIHLGFNIANNSNVLDKFMLLNEIYNNISEKKATMTICCEEKRFKKLKSYGWNIVFISNIFIYSFKEVYDGDCIICQDKIPEHECRVRYINCSCDLRICLKCIVINHSKLDNCPLCKKKTYSYSPVEELTILSYMNTYKALRTNI